MLQKSSSLRGITTRDYFKCSSKNKKCYSVFSWKFTLFQLQILMHFCVKITCIYYCKRNLLISFTLLHISFLQKKLSLHCWEEKLHLHFCVIFFHMHAAAFFTLLLTKKKHSKTLHASMLYSCKIKIKNIFVYSPKTIKNKIWRKFEDFNCFLLAVLALGPEWPKFATNYFSENDKEF